MGFQNIKEWLNQQKVSAQESIIRFKNKDFLEAVVAGCALVAAADGKIDAREKEIMAGFIQRDDALKVFDMSQVIASFNKIAANFEFNAIIGKAEALKTVAKIKANEEAARLLIRVCCAIGMADGDLDENEKAIVREICTELALNPSDFGLGAETSDSPKSSHRASTVKPVTRAAIAPFKTKDFLEAVIASCALVAAADGKVDAREKETLANFIRRHDALKVFETAQALDSFDKFITNFEFSAQIGKAEAFAAIQKIQSNKESAQLVVRLCLDIALADENVTDNEKDVVKKICAVLILNPIDFGI